MTPKTFENHICVRQTDKDNNSAENIWTWEQKNDIF